MGVIYFTFLIQILFYPNYLAENIKSRVVGGEMSDIEHHPYCAALSIGPYKRKGAAWSCGASIINQRVLLTAAHCLEGCSRKKKCIIIILVGHSNKEAGASYLTRKFKIHEEYDQEYIENDIGLIFTNQNMKLNKAVSKVILMENPPYREHAVVAGWGATHDVDINNPSKWLKHLEQNIISTTKCQKILRRLPNGTVCAKKFSKPYEEYVSVGDSGSALVVRNVIQVGLVSYKNPLIQKALVVYTDVGHFYYWIKKTAEKHYCIYTRKS